VRARNVPDERAKHGARTKRDGRRLRGHRAAARTQVDARQLVEAAPLAEERTIADALDNARAHVLRGEQVVACVVDRQERRTAGGPLIRVGEELGKTNVHRAIIREVEGVQQSKLGNGVHERLAPVRECNEGSRVCDGKVSVVSSSEN
jgi:hypothetical protein